MRTTKSFSVTVPKELAAEIERAAKGQGRSRVVVSGLAGPQSGDPRPGGGSSAGYAVLRLKSTILGDSNK
jgi:hypothetical protein